MPPVIELPRISVAEKEMLAALTARQPVISKFGPAVRPRLHAFAPQQSPMPMPGGFEWFAAHPERAHAEGPRSALRPL